MTEKQSLTRLLLQWRMSFMTRVILLQQEVELWPASCWAMALGSAQMMMHSEFICYSVIGLFPSRALSQDETSLYFTSSERRCRSISIIQIHRWRSRSVVPNHVPGGLLNQTHLIQIIRSLLHIPSDYIFCVSDKGEMQNVQNHWSRWWSE